LKQKISALKKYPNPVCEIVGKGKFKHRVIHIDCPYDAKILISCLEEFLESIPKEFGGNK
jgi:hypothetical protein